MLDKTSELQWSNLLVRPRCRSGPHPGTPFGTWARSFCVVVFQGESKISTLSCVARVLLMKKPEKNKETFEVLNLAKYNLSWGPLHTRAKSCDHEIVRAQNRVSKARPKHMKLRTLVCSVKSYVTETSTKCYINVFLLMPGPHTW